MDLDSGIDPVHQNKRIILLLMEYMYIRKHLVFFQVFFRKYEFVPQQFEIESTHIITLVASLKHEKNPVSFKISVEDLTNI